MEGKDRFNPRNWEFTDDRHSESILKPTLDVSLLESNASGYQTPLLKIGVYSDQTAALGQPHSESSATDITWASQRSFLHPTPNNNQSEAVPGSPELINVQSMQIGEITSQLDADGPIDAKPINARMVTSKEKHAGVKAVRLKEVKKQPSASGRKKGCSPSTGHLEKNNSDHLSNAVIMDLSSIPGPVCSCTGVARQCYRWGRGGWQSSCCTTSLSVYPLPASPRRPGARVAGRKMSSGVYIKLLHRLAAEGHDLSYAVDLKDHWARHGTNKFVTIR